METKKTNTPDTSVRASFALFQGAMLAMSYPLIYLMAPTFVRSSPYIVLFLVLPLLSFLSSLFINWFLQYLYCGAVSFSTILNAALVSPAASVGLSGLVYMLPFLRSPVTQIIPEMPQMSPEEAAMTKEIWGYSFYLFWAGVYGQTIGSGMLAVCP